MVGMSAVEPAREERTSNLRGLRSAFDHPQRTFGHSQGNGQIDPRTPFGTLGMPGAGPHLGSELLGDPEYRYHSSQLGQHQGNPGKWTLIQMTRSIPSQKLHWSWTPWLQKAYRKKMR